MYEKLDQDRRRPVEDIPEHIQDRENDRIKEIERSRKQPTYVHLEVEELSVEEMYRRLIKYHEPKAAQIKVRVEGPDDVYDIAAIIKAKVEKLNKATQSND